MLELRFKYKKFALAW